MPSLATRLPEGERRALAELIYEDLSRVQTAPTPAADRRFRDQKLARRNRVDRVERQKSQGLTPVSLDSLWDQECYVDPATLAREVRPAFACGRSNPYDSLPCNRECFT